MPSISKKSLGAIIITVFILYGVGGPALADKIVPYMKDAEEKSECTYISDSQLGCNCVNDGFAINEKYSQIYYSLNMPAELLESAQSNPRVSCHCVKPGVKTVLENGTCGYEDAPRGYRLRKSLNAS